MWALISGGVVCETTDIDPAGRFHADLQWLQCEEIVQPGWGYGASGFTAPESELQQAPQACTPAQGLVALFALKTIKEEDVLAAIAQIPDPVQQYTALIGYQRATSWERGSPTMLAMAQLLQLSEQDLDELFSYAVGVVV